MRLAKGDLPAAESGDDTAGTLLYVALTRHDPTPERISGLLDMVLNGIR